MEKIKAKNMSAKSVEDFDVAHKKVLLRADIDVPVGAGGEIGDDFRLRAAVVTVRYLLQRKAKVILMGHLGRPKGRVVEDLTVRPVAKWLGSALGLHVDLASDCLGKEAEEKSSALKSGRLLLLENLRFHEGEEKNDPDFAGNLAKLGDIFINDAFAVCHRTHASMVLLPKLMPSGAGLSLAKEISSLSKILYEPKRPLVAVIGGAKVSTKAKLIQSFLEKSDHVLLGGIVANVVLTAKKIAFKKNHLSVEDKEALLNLNLTSEKLHIPVDLIVSKDKKGRSYVRESAPAAVGEDELALDIGPETINLFSKIIESAGTIVWSGPLGLFEEPPFEKGTFLTAENISNNKNAFKIAGGGDTLFAISKFGMADSFDHLSTGGGAMLSFLSGQTLPGLEALGY